VGSFACFEPVRRNSSKGEKEEEGNFCAITLAHQFLSVSEQGWWERIDSMRFRRGGMRCSWPCSPAERGRKAPEQKKVLVSPHPATMLLQRIYSSTRTTFSVTGGTSGGGGAVTVANTNGRIHAGNVESPSLGLREPKGRLRACAICIGD
jgi:hypothetical protein